MTVTAILQARTSSSRLPGKVLADIEGRPMLARQIDRVKRSRRIDALVIATSMKADDDAVADLADALDLPCVRGPLEDVLARFAKAANAYPADDVMRLTGDCPLLDPELLDELIVFHLKGGYDYSSLALERTYPHGLDAEIMKAEVLRTAWREAQTAYEREHVTPYIYSNPVRFTLGSMRQSTDQSHLRWTVDFPEDLAFVRVVFAALLPVTPEFSWRDVLKLLETHPEIMALNASRTTSQSALEAVFP